MATIYCDQNVLVSVLDREGFPPTGAFRRLVDSGAEPVFSAVHLVEASKRKSLEEATHLAQLIDWCVKYWLVAPSQAEMNELRKAFGVSDSPVLTRTLTEAITGLCRIPLGDIPTAVRVVRAWHSRPETLRLAERDHMVAGMVFTRNVRSFKAPELASAEDEALFRPILRKVVKSYGIQASQDQIDRVALEDLPSFHVSLVLNRLKYRRGGGYRWQKFMDDHHLLVGLPYSDFYVTYDIKQRKLARTLCRLCTSCRADVVGSLEEIMVPGAA